MTRKDYNLIAATIRETRTHFIKGSESEQVLDFLVDNLVTQLLDTNPRFDDERFWKACGVEA